jgi:hypothetical protein
MDRRDFLRLCGIGSLGMVVAPVVIFNSAIPVATKCTVGGSYVGKSWVAGDLQAKIALQCARLQERRVLNMLEDR